MLEFNPPDSILKVNSSNARKVPTLSPSEVQPSIRSSRDGDIHETPQKLHSEMKLDGKLYGPEAVPMHIEDNK